MKLKPVRNEDDHATALERVGELWEAVAGSARADELEVLCLLVADYEDKHHEIAPSDPIDLLKFVMEQRGIARKDLYSVIGESGRVSEILNRKRRLTLEQIRGLAALNISPAILIQEYDLAE